MRLVTEWDEELASQVTARMTAEPAFRDAMLADANAALQDMGIELPQPSHVRHTAAGWVFVPLANDIAEDELPDEVLELSGGGTTVNCQNGKRREFG